MFKPLVLRRNFSLFSRVPYSRLVNLAARNGHASIAIHRVRIRKPFFRTSRLVGAFVIATATYAAAQAVGLKVEVKEIEAKDKQPSPSARPGEDGWTTVGQVMDGEDGNDEDDEEVLLFLPTGFSRPQQKTFYKGTDPEWQEFRKLATDGPRAARIRAQLVFILRSILAENPTWVQRLGQIDISKGKFWVEFKFPDGPPLEYEKPGIELTDKLEWRKATRPVEFHHHHRLTRLLYPQAAASALYKDTTKKTRGLWNHFRAYMGWHQESKADTVEQLVQRIAADPQSSDTQPASTTPGPTSTSATDSQQPSISSSTVSIDGPPKDLSLLPDRKKMTLDLSQFRADFCKASRPSLAQPPRGVFSIIGLVEVHGDRAKGSFSVNAIYDPKKGAFFHIHATAWNVTEYKQRPRGD